MFQHWFLVVGSAAKPEESSDHESSSAKAAGLTGRTGMV